MAPDRTDPFTLEGEWLRCALHAHTTGSDGELEPDALAAHYGRAGFDVLAITDHWKRTEAASNGGLLVLPSVELNCILPAARDGHVLGFGLSADADLAALGAEYADLERTAAFITEHGGVAYLAHPYWTGATPGTLELPENVAGIEVWNAGCELEVGRGLSSVHWDELLESGRRCFGLVTDDSHHPGFDSGHGWTAARAERSAEAVLAALAAGSFYGSSGPCCTRCSRRDRSRGALQPGRSVTSSPVARGGRERGASRLPLRGRGARGRRPRDHACAAAAALRRGVRPHRGDRREGQSRVDESVVRDLSQLAERRFDLLVIGGGIVGAGIANEAAQAGLAVALVDRGDFGGATSSASSKLIHGGLRYLRLGDVKLVREAHRERRALLKTVAPHLVRRLPFLFPLYRLTAPTGRRRSGSGSPSTRARR
jgi:hypothetical protein